MNKTGEPVASKPVSTQMAITAYTATSCLGRGVEAARAALDSGKSYLRPCDFLDTQLPTWVGEVDGLDDEAVTGGLAPFDCRNNRLAMVGLEQDGFHGAVRAAVQRYGADRVGVFLGSSTSGLLNTELAYRERDANTGALPEHLHYEQTHNMSSLANFVGQYLQVGGPRYVCSIACASSAKVFASGARAIAMGQVDAAVVGGVDTLCLTTLYGFGSLELLSPDRCKPFDIGRNGISIGEAAGFALLEAPSAENAQAPLLAGYGETSDAYHMSAPHPEGMGAQRAIIDALQRARCSPADIDYINLHGTATPSNDNAEDAAVFTVFGDQVPASSTKGAHGHTLGAAGALEAVISLLALRTGQLPGGINIDAIDPALRTNYIQHSRASAARRVVSNSFGFGGANAALVFVSGSK